MRLGLMLTAQHPEGEDPAAALAGHLALAGAARDAGFDVLLVSQHYLSSPYGMLQPFPLLGRLAGECPGMRLGTGVLLLTLLNPVDVAEQAATLDHLTGGRFVLGVGLGYRPQERAAFGVPDRAARVFLDKVDVVKRLLAGEEVTASGHGYHLEGARLALAPVQRPRPPVWMAANTDTGVRRAARHADAWVVNPHARETDLAGQLALYRERCVAAPGELPVTREVVVAPTDDEAVDIARRHLAPKYAAYVGWGQSEAMPEGDTLDRAFGDLAADRFVVGSPATVAERIRAVRDRLGATHLLARVTWPGMPLGDALRSVALLREAAALAA